MLHERFISRNTPCSVVAIISSSEDVPGSRLMFVMRMIGDATSRRRASCRC